MLHQLVWDIDSTFGSEHNIFEYTEEEYQSLSDDLKQLLKGLHYLYSALELIHSTTTDGFLSIYYNCTGKEIETYLHHIRVFNDPTASYYEEAYILLKPIFKIPYDSNVITASTVDFENSPYELLDKDTEEKIDQINDFIEALEDVVYEKLMTTYQSIL